MVAALTFLVAYAVPILRPELSTDGPRLCQVVVWVTWAVFVLYYLVRLLLAESRARWFLVHLIDLAIIALPLLRPLRLLRLVTLLNVLNRKASTGLRGKARRLCGGRLGPAGCRCVRRADGAGYPRGNGERSHSW